MCACVHLFSKYVYTTKSFISSNGNWTRAEGRDLRTMRVNVSSHCLISILAQKPFFLTCEKKVEGRRGCAKLLIHFCVNLCTSLQLAITIIPIANNCKQLNTVKHYRACWQICIFFYLIRFWKVLHCTQWIFYVHCVQCPSRNGSTGLMWKQEAQPFICHLSLLFYFIFLSWLSNLKHFEVNEIKVQNKWCTEH